MLKPAKLYNDKGMILMQKKIISVLLILTVLLSMVISFSSCGEKETEIQRYNVDTEVLKVGIMSDNQLQQEGSSEKYSDFLRKGLELFKEKDVDMLVNVGDFTDQATEEAYQNYKNIFDSVYSDGESPITSMIMGNHDYWLPMFVDCWEIPFKSKMRNRFMEYTGETSPWTHKVINGYHFIGCSPTSGDMDDSAYEKKIDWLKTQIESAIKEDPNKPVFVFTHSNPIGTVNNKDYGCTNLNELFSNYPQVVSISGHTHASLMSESSIWQGDYTALSTQCLSYVAFDKGDVIQEDGIFDEDNPIELIMEIENDKITIRRYNILTGEEVKDPWIINLPINKDTFVYTDENRKAESVSPTWNEGWKAEISSDENGVWLSFPAAVHPDLVEMYKLEFIDASGKKVVFTKGDEENPVEEDFITCVSDYTKLPEERSETVKINLKDFIGENGLKEGEKYTVSVSAAGTFSEFSEAKIGEIVL